MEKILEILGANPLAVISTVASDDGRPESALVAFAENGAGELFFGTSNKTRKYDNIVQDNRISMVVGWGGAGSLQIEGVAKQLAGSDADLAITAVTTKNPHSEKFLKKDDARLFAVSVSWIRMTDLATGKVEEVRP